MSLAKFPRKVNSQQFALPVVRTELRQKSHKGVHLEYLAKFLDDKRGKAQWNVPNETQTDQQEQSVA
nr:pyocin activator PrtN family protein [Ruegeria lacuscaerulensis]